MITVFKTEKKTQNYSICFGNKIYTNINVHTVLGFGISKTIDILKL